MKDSGPIYVVRANGKIVPVDVFSDQFFARLVFDDTCRVEVQLRPSIGQENRKFIHQCEFRPYRRVPEAAVHRGTMSYAIDKSAYYCIRFDEYPPLYVLADRRKPGERLPEGTTLHASDFVTDKTGVELQTAALQKAIDAVPKGGALHLEAGTYLTGTLALKSHMTLHLDEGAVLLSSPSPTDLRRSVRSGYGPFALLMAEDCENLIVSGYGTIDARGVEMRPKGVDGRVLAMADCRNVVVEGLTLLDSPAWNTHLTNCVDTVLKNVKVISHLDVLNTDGVDLESCTNTVMRDSFIFCGDDAACLKGKGAVDSTSVRFIGNTIYSLKSALKLGSEVNASRDISFEDNDILGCDRGMSLYIEDGAEIEDVRFVGNRFEKPVLDAKQRLIDFYTHDRKGDGKGGGQIRKVLIKDTVVDQRWPRSSTIMSFHGSFDGIHFDHFTIAGKVCESLGEADVLVENYPSWDGRKPNVRNITFAPGGKPGWNPAMPGR
ncbi:MAG: right-handed parallel beta-helix repeat-containing protein [Lentisphaerae bacterium]|nr:right-handed parallel beta-helix repeat-containing protein [Lentisphaerota bacterium]